MYQMYWAKSDRGWTSAMGGNRPWMPFAGHVAAVTLVAEELLAKRPILLRKLCRLVECHDWTEKDVKNYVLFAAATHDIGKLTIFFQGFVPDLVSQNGLYQGLNVPCKSGISERWNHGNGGFIVGSLRPQMTPCEQSAFWVGSWHHGTAEPASSRSYEAFKDYYKGQLADGKGKLYAAIDRQAVKDFLDEVRCLYSLHPERPQSKQFSRFTELVGGIVSVSDWRASNEAIFRLEPNWAPTTFLQFMQDPVWRQRAKDSVACFDAMPQRQQQDLSVEYSVLQEYISKLQDYDLTIIEAPTGDGKTEAAFLTMLYHLEQGNADSVLFTEPMKVAATLMHGRVLKGFASQIYNINDVALSHTTAKDYRKATRGQVFGDPFFYSAKRALLARAVVATIDQAMQAVMKGKRHDFVRRLGLSTSVVVIDEVHASDVYMYGIITTLLELLGILKVPVTLLSATLTQDSRKMLYDAYMKGLGSVNPIPPATDLHGNIVVREDAVVVTSANRDQTKVVTMPSRRSERILQVCPIQHGLTTIERVKRADDNDVIMQVKSLVGDFLEHKACVGWIRNTVWDVQRMHRFVQDALKAHPLYSDDARGRVFFLHASLHANERKEVEDAVTNILGPKGDRKDGCLVIGTNILGTSCDIDFDRMVIDSTTIENLIQASGRVHRHAFNDDQRPEHLREKKLEVFVPSAMDVRNIYDFTHEGNSWWHQATQEWVLEGHSFNDPRDVRDIMEGIYQKQPVDQHGKARADRDLLVNEYLQRHSSKNTQNVSSERPNSDQDQTNTPTRFGVSNRPIVFFYVDEHNILRAEGTDKYVDVSGLSEKNDDKQNALNLRSKVHGVAPYTYLTELIDEVSASRSKLQVTHIIKLDNPTTWEKVLNGLWSQEGMYPDHVVFIESRDPSKPRQITRQSRPSSDGKQSPPRSMNVSYQPELGLIVEG